jgi:hypothetical protein
VFPQLGKYYTTRKFQWLFSTDILFTYCESFPVSHYYGIGTEHLSHPSLFIHSYDYFPRSRISVTKGYSLLRVLKYMAILHFGIFMMIYTPLRGRYVSSIFLLILDFIFNFPLCQFHMGILYIHSIF